MSEVKLDDIVSLAKRRGFIFPGSEIYGGLAGVYDYGPLGVMLKHNIENLWWSSFVTAWDDMYPLDSAILGPEKVFEASGHLAGFKDPMVVCSNCHSQFRADHILEDAIEKNKAVIHDQLTADLKTINANMDVFRPLIKCAHCGKVGTLGEARQFNMMLATEFGAVQGEGQKVYLRPETAQGMFTNFKNIVDTFSPDMPFGIAQIGKVFRNEISPRDFVFRLREAEFMEIEYFVHPDKWEESFEEWRVGVLSFYKKLGLPSKMIHEQEIAAEDRAHYSKRTIDFEFDFPFGQKELTGLAYRTDYDLKHHQEFSGKNLEYRPKDGGKPFIPHVIEPAFGLDRLVLAVLTAAYSTDKQGEEERIFLKLPADLAPVKVAVLPLVKNKPELTQKAAEVYYLLRKELMGIPLPKKTGGIMPVPRSSMSEVAWVDSGNIGKNYRKMDEIGTPYCVTIDFDTLEDNTVTLRDRDTTKQERLKTTKLVGRLTAAND